DWQIANGNQFPPFAIDFEKQLPIGQWIECQYGKLWQPSVLSLVVNPVYFIVYFLDHGIHQLTMFSGLRYIFINYRHNSTYNCQVMNLNAFIHTLIPEELGLLSHLIKILNTIS
ncbi:unnamed protein product, partial [Owenia fusiformis]